MLRFRFVRGMLSIAVTRRWPAAVEACGYAVTKYVMLRGLAGGELRRDKRGAIPEGLAPILDRLGVDRSSWVETVRDFGRMFSRLQVECARSCTRRRVARGSGFRGRLPHELRFFCK
jgi:hypothetical protein